MEGKLGFFGHVIAPSNSIKLSENEEFELMYNLNSAALDGATAKKGRTTLYVKVGDAPRIALCTLDIGKSEQWNLSQTFTPIDGSVEFSCEGVNSIHLTGFAEPLEDDDEDDEDAMCFDDDCSDDECCDIEPESEKSYIEEIEKEVEEKTPVKKVEKKTPAKKEEKKTPAKKEEKKTPAKKEEKKTPVEKEEKKTPAKKEENNKKRKNTETAEAVSVPKKMKPAKKMNKGVAIEEVAIGKGRPLKKGKKVKILYKGKLTNGKQFDSCTSRKRPFEFRYGIGEVVKGMDIGLEGMLVGGKRIITIPSHLGYGKSGAPPSIPPNSTLVFEMELIG